MSGEGIPTDETGAPPSFDGEVAVSQSEQPDAAKGGQGIATDNGGSTSTVQCCTAQPETPQPKKTTTIRASMFFDGTLNNRVNTTIRLTQPDNKHVADTSYQNDFSNVARLEENLMSTAPGYEHYFHLYTEGAGTEDAGGDVTVGMALGMGKTGVFAKVDKGYDGLVSKIHGIPTTTRIIKIDLDSFGFSRGATEARMFVYKVLKDLRRDLVASGYDIGDISVKFVGLWDSVSSYGTDHDDDVTQLNLTAISAAEKVVHLCAAEEHRINFALTTIESCVGNGTQVFLPGVHCDIGGAYNSVDGESGRTLFSVKTNYFDDADCKAVRDRDRRWLIDQGWYTAEHITSGYIFPFIYNTVNRSDVYNTYSYIPLHMMADQARQLGVPVISFLENSFSIASDDFLVGCKAKLYGYYGAVGNSSKATDWFHQTTPPPSAEGLDLRTLRRHFLHHSEKYDLTETVNQMAPRWNPDEMTGRRERQLYHG